MNIVFIGPFGLQPKSTMRERALPLAKALVSRGHRVTLLIPPWDDPERAGQSWEDEGVQVVNVTLPGPTPLFFHAGLTYSLVKRALALQPEVIHFFKPKAYAGLAHVALWGLRRLGHRSVRLVLDTDDWEQAWNDILSYSTLQKRLFAWQEIWGLRHADAVTVASRALEQWVRRYRDGASPGVHYLPNGYSPIKEEARLSLTSTTPQVVREQWRLDSAPTVLLYSRFLEFRLGRVVALVGQVARQLPQARWLIVGRGLNGEEKELERQVNQAGLGRYVNFTGWLPLDQLPAYFQAADVAIFPYDDTWLNRTKCSIKLIDLLSTGLPVVADAVGQNCEYIQHNKTGILAPAGDDVAFGQALVELLQSPDQRRRLGQAAARAIREQFDWLQLAQSVERAYH